MGGCPILADFARVGIFGPFHATFPVCLNLNPHPLKFAKNAAPAFSLRKIMELNLRNYLRLAMLFQFCAR